MMTNIENLTSTERLAAFYTLSHALEYVAQTNTEPWEVTRTFQPVARILQPLIDEMRKPFADAAIFKLKAGRA